MRNTTGWQSVEWELHRSVITPLCVLVGVLVVVWLKGHITEGDEMVSGKW